MPVSKNNFPGNCVVVFLTACLWLVSAKSRGAQTNYDFSSVTAKVVAAGKEVMLSVEPAKS